MKNPRSLRDGSRPTLRHLPLVATAAVALAMLAACSSGSSPAASGTSPATSSTGSSAGAGVDAAARAKLPADIVSKGKLVNGINVPNPPMEFHDTTSNTLTGLDVELTNALAAKLGLTADYSEVQFEQLLPSLTTGRADIVLSALSDTKERQAIADWVDYFKSGDRFYTTNDLAAKYPDYASLCGQTVAVASGTSFVQDVPALSATVCAGKSPMKVLAIGARAPPGWRS